MRVDWQKTASMLFCILVAAGAFFLVGKYVITIVMPFLIAWGLALFLRPLAKKLSEKSRIPPRLASVAVLLLLFTALGLLLFWGVNRLVEELGRLAERISSGQLDIGGHFSLFVDSLSFHMPLAAEGESLRGRFDEVISSILREVGGKLISAVTAFATSLVRALPSITLFVVVTLIASFYFALDLDTIHRSMTGLLPQRIAQRLPDIRARTRRFLSKYLRAYLFLMFLTFCELFVGFSILSVEYSFLLALTISTVDILPALGVGTVLVPWSIIELLTRDFRRGFGLLILWAVITVVRQTIEPRIVGGSLGLHPIVTLVGMYVGFRLFGIAGMLIAPAASVAIKVLLKEWIPYKKSA